MLKLQDLDFKNNLIPVAVQNFDSRKMLMLAYASPEAVAATLESGYAHFWSRSRSRLWKKGETSGNMLKIRRVLVDCDKDALLYQVEPAGPACHTGRESCFYRELAGGEM
jgi:phosphoribosyl-AMP cyclohydrolase